MRARSLRRVRSEGFVLLHVLWLLLVAATLAAGSMAAVFHSSEELAISERRLRTHLAHESAVEMVIHDVLVTGNGSAWMGGGIVTRSMQAGEQRVSVSVQHAAGLIDPLASDPRILDRLRARLGIPRGTQRPGAPPARSADALRPATYADLQALLGLDDKAFACLYPHITLYSDRTEPDLRHASDRLAELAGLGSGSPEAPSVLGGNASDGTIGATFRVNVFSGNVPGAAAGLSVEVTITGQIAPSHLVRSRQRILAPQGREQACT